MIGLTALAGTAQAQDANWLLNPGSGDYTTGANWDGGTVPGSGDTGFFNNSNTTSLTFSANTTVGGWTFNGASNFDFTLGAFDLDFDGAGIVVNGGSATINNSAFLEFYDTSSAGSADITNDFNLNFNNNSTAGSATITNNEDMFFNDTSTAGSATIDNNSILNFNDDSMAGSAAITNSGGLIFNDSSTAGSANIANGGYMSFNNASTAGSTVIINDDKLYFFDASTADSATITNNDVLQFRLGSTAGSATITNSNFLFFDESSTADDATITNNSIMRFFGLSTAGQAQITTNAGAETDFSGTAGPSNNNALTAGSLAGAGDYFLGANQVTVGGNNLSTEVSGVIQDGGYVGGVGGSLEKNGSGTFTLSGANTYTGPTSVNNGTLAVNGSITSDVTVNTGGTLGGTGTVGDVIINNGGNLAPGNSIGMLTIGGDLSLLADSLLQIEIESASVFDVLNITGDLFASDGFTLELSFLNDFTPENGAVFDFMNVAGTTTLADLALVNIIANGLGSGYGVALTSLNGVFSVLVSSTTPSEVPLPGAIWFMGVGLAAIAASRRRRALASA